MQRLDSNLDPRLIADYFLARDEDRIDPDVTQMKLHKLMYFAQAHYLAEAGLPLFQSVIRAYQHGPVVDNISQEFRQYGRATIVVHNDQVATAAKMNAEELPAPIRHFLDQVWAQYGSYSASQLRAMTHEEAPWVEVWDESTPFLPIAEETMISYYRHQIPQERHISLENVTYVPLSVWEELEALESAM